MELCNNCGEEIKQFTLTNAAMEVAGGKKILISRLSCPFCNYVQHTFASDLPVTELSKKVTELEEKVKRLEHEIQGGKNQAPRPH